MLAFTRIHLNLALRYGSEYGLPRSTEGRACSKIFADQPNRAARRTLEHLKHDSGISDLMSIWRRFEGNRQHQPLLEYEIANVRPKDQDIRYWTYAAAGPERRRSSPGERSAARLRLSDPHKHVGVDGARRTRRALSGDSRRLHGNTECSFAARRGSEGDASQGYQGIWIGSPELGRRSRCHRQAVLLERNKPR